MAEPQKSSTMKLVGATVLLLIGVGFAYNQYSKFTPPPAPERGQMQVRAGGGPPAAAAGTQRMGPPSEADRKKFRDEMIKDLNLTPEQQAQVQAVEKEMEGKDGPENMRARFEAMDKILTPEQKQQARAKMGEHMKARMQEHIKTLSSEDQQKFMQKLDERMKNGGGPFGPPPGGPGGPGGPEGPPPGGPPE
jgi:Spy/CpxP family protein refolding chaperone